MTTSGSRERPVRIGVQIEQQHALYGSIRDAVRACEDMGVDVIFNWDHFFPLDGDPEGLHFESWTMLGAIAEQTERAEIGCLVNCNSYRNPDLQADMARTIDHISGGRFIFGTGAGWFEKDYSEYGFEFGTPGRRLDTLAAAMPRIEARWSRLNPPPLRKIPVLIGGGGERKTLRLVARHADIWHSFSDAQTLQRKLGVLAEHCAVEGRNIADIEISIERATPSSAAALHALGATLFTIGVSGPDYPLDRVRTMIAWRDSVNGAG
jgi:probable F420-dependent oxidoreductase